MAATRVSATTEFSRFIEQSGAHVPPEVLALAKLHILDTLGCQVAFAGLPWSQDVQRYAAEQACAGNATISYDVAPFVSAAERNEIHGLNLIGLRRQGITAAALCDLKRCYHAVFGNAGDMRRRAAEALDAGLLGIEPPGKAFLEFFAGGRRGFSRTRTRTARTNGATKAAVALPDPSAPAP